MAHQIHCFTQVFGLLGINLDMRRQIVYVNPQRGGQGYFGEKDPGEGNRVTFGEMISEGRMGGIFMTPSIPQGALQFPQPIIQGHLHKYTCPWPSRVASPKLPSPTLQRMPQTSHIATLQCETNWTTNMVTSLVWSYFQI